MVSNYMLRLVAYYSRITCLLLFGISHQEKKFSKTKNYRNDLTKKMTGQLGPIVTLKSE